MKQHKTLTTALTALAKLEKRKAELENKHCAKVAELENKHAASVEPLEAEMNTIRTAIAAYANAHREELTENGKVKSIKIGSGCLKWQKNRAKVEITGDTAAIIAALKRRKLNHFIRTREELDKTAILKEPTAIKRPIDGLTIIQGGASETLTIDTGV